MILGLVGNKGVGKDEVAKILIAYGFRTVSLAGPMKDQLGAWLGFTHEQLYGPSEMRESPHPTIKRLVGEMTLRHGFVSDDIVRFAPLDARFALKAMLESGRACDVHIWSRLAMKEARYLESLGIDVVITDLRRFDEVAYCREHGAWIGRIHRHLVEQDLRDEHVSEQDQALFDDASMEFVIANDYSLEVLKSTVGAMIPALRRDWETIKRRRG